MLLQSIKYGLCIVLNKVSIHIFLIYLKIPDKSFNILLNWNKQFIKLFIVIFRLGLPASKNSQPFYIRLS